MKKTISEVTGLDALFRPRAIALMGVSDRSGSYGAVLEEVCRKGGYTGRVFGVNPRLAAQRQDVYGTLDDVPQAPDHVVISLSSNTVENAVDEALRVGSKTLTIFAQCPDQTMRERIAAKINAAGAVLCGPNNMGLHDIAIGVRLTPFPAPLSLKAGGVGLISQSGSVLGALMNNGRRFRFSQAVSTGSESVCTVADQLAWMVERPEIRCTGSRIQLVLCAFGEFETRCSLQRHQVVVKRQIMTCDP